MCSDRVDWSWQRSRWAGSLATLRPIYGAFGHSVSLRRCLRTPENVARLVAEAGFAEVGVLARNDQGWHLVRIAPYADDGEQAKWHDRRDPPAVDRNHDRPTDTTPGPPRSPPARSQNVGLTTRRGGRSTVLHSNNGFPHQDRDIAPETCCPRGPVQGMRMARPRTRPASRSSSAAWKLSSG